MRPGFTKGLIFGVPASLALWALIGFVAWRLFA
ncbi:hypothetical protein EVC08_031 [Rhizobium phage RHph_N65]|nr:hypothetical protein EVC08_031 [Rhizobium phage RHph_N65]